MNADIESAGAMITAGLAAHELDGIAGKSVAAHASHDGRADGCANCGTLLAGSFCHGCGQRGHLHRSLLHLGEEFLHGMLHFDAKAWRTLPLLVARPGELTRRYIDGHRTRYVSPLALFLFMVFLLFFVGSATSQGNAVLEPGTASAGSAERAEKVRAKLDAKRPVLEAARAEASDGAPAADGDDAEALTGIAQVDAAIAFARDNPEYAVYKLKNTAYKYSFLLVPITLPFLWLMFFWRRGVTMYDHAVFSLYSLSFMSLLFVILFLLKSAGLKTAVASLLFIVPPVHLFFQLRGTYRLGLGGALWRTAALVLTVSAVFVLYLMLILYLSMR